MKTRSLALAVPLAVGIACTHQTGAMSRPSDENRQAAAQEQQGQQQAAGGGAATGRRDPLMQPGPAVQGHAEDQIVNGRVAAATDSSVTIETEQGDKRTLQIVPQTTVQLDGQDASGADLAEGVPVRASFDTVDGQEVAVKVQAGDTGTGNAASQGTGSSAGDQGTGAQGTPEPTAPPDQGAVPAPAPGDTPPDAGWGPPPGGSSAPGEPPRGRGW
jgi:hypothetical protein